MKGVSRPEKAIYSSYSGNGEPSGTLAPYFRILETTVMSKIPQEVYMLMKYAQSINLQVHFSPQKRNRSAQAHTRYSELLHVSTMRTIATQTMTVNRLNPFNKGIAPSSSVVT